MSSVKISFGDKMSQWQKICPVDTKPSSIVRHGSILFVIGAIHRTLHENDADYSKYVKEGFYGRVNDFKNVTNISTESFGE